MLDIEVIELIGWESFFGSGGSDLDFSFGDFGGIAVIEFADVGVADSGGFINVIPVLSILLTHVIIQYNFQSLPKNSK